MEDVVVRDGIADTPVGPVHVGSPHVDVTDVEKGDIKSLPLLDFKVIAENVAICIADSPASTVQACALIEQDINNGLCGRIRNIHGVEKAAVGFDTETKPNYTKGAKQNKVALIQIATDARVCLFHIHFSSGGKDFIQPKLLQLLTDKNIAKVGVGVENDEVALRTRIPKFTSNGSFVSLEKILRVKYPGLRRLGLRNATATLFGLRMSKRWQMCNWEQKLRGGMIHYAACDAWIGLRLLDVSKPETKVNYLGTGCVFAPGATKKGNLVATLEESFNNIVTGGEEYLEYNCSLCRRSFPSEDALASHNASTSHKDTQAVQGIILEVHTPEGTVFSCGKCECSKTVKKRKTFFSVKALSAHFKSVHTDPQHIAAKNKQTVRRKKRKFDLRT